MITDINIKDAIIAPNGQMENEAYHAHDGISSSGLNTIFQKTPAHYRYGEHKSTSALEIGTASHAALLEPHLFDDMVAVQPADIKQRRGSKWDAFLAEVGDKIILKESEYNEIIRMQKVMHDDPEYGELLKGAAIETSIICDIKVQGCDDWIRVKVRPDIITRDYQVPDYKTTTDASMENFGRSIVNNGYLLRQAFVCDVLTAFFSAKRGEETVFTPSLLAQEKSAPFIAQKYDFTPGQIAAGRAMWHDTIVLYAQCLKHNKWPAYFRGSTELVLPAWANKQLGIEDE